MLDGHQQARLLERCIQNADEVCLTANRQVEYAASEILSRVSSAADEMRRPSAVYRPKLCPDGNQWCALYGANLMEGVAGYGDSPAAAMEAFDCAWRTSRPEAMKAAEQARGGA